MSYVLKICTYIQLSQDKKTERMGNYTIHSKKNNFPKHLIQKLNWKIQQKTKHIQPNGKQHKTWTTFTYHSPKIRKITNLFKNTQIGIAFKATTILQHLIQTTPQTQTSDYEKSGLYKIICNTCNKAYIGQTSRDLKSRFRAHTRYIKK